MEQEKKHVDRLERRTRVWQEEKESLSRVIITGSELDINPPRDCSEILSLC